MRAILVLGLLFITGYIIGTITKHCNHKEVPVIKDTLKGGLIDYCDRCNDVTILSTEGKITIRPNETKVFEIKITDEYTKSGGWYWHCGDWSERTRINGAKFVKIERDDKSKIIWSAVER